MLGAVVRGALVVRLAVGFGLLVRFTVGRGLADREGEGFTDEGAGAAEVGAGLAEVGSRSSTGAARRPTLAEGCAAGRGLSSSLIRFATVPNPQTHRTTPTTTATMVLPVFRRFGAVTRSSVVSADEGEHPPNGR